MPEPSSLEPGLIVLHGNRLEPLRDVCLEWLARYPLGPLENEAFLVQSNGIAQWIQMAMAAPEGSGWGIAFGVETLLPARFQWLAYREVLAASGVTLPEHSPFDESRLRWRLLRLIPELIGRSEFEPLAHFLAADTDGRKAFQLAARLAALFDQYQVYRADWLAAWARGDDHITDAQGKVEVLPKDQRWQPALWRALRDDLAPEIRDTDRGSIHARFLAAAQRLRPDALPPKLPRRLVVFGMASLPEQMLDALAALARHAVQVVVCMVNPCRHYWGDLIEQRELLAGQYRRQSRKPGTAETVDLDQLHLHAQPLLAAWGRQARDALHMLDAHDERDRYAALFRQGGLRLDVFTEPDSATLLGQLQDDILDLRSIDETRTQWPTVDAARDASIVFHVAHSPQRELEVLHDQLLAAFAAEPHLEPRDVIVMVPDIATFAPHIHAVFGQFERGDRRHIPYQLADRQQRRQAPLLVALERLLALPSLRLRASEVLDLLEVPAVGARFRIDAADLPQLRAWIESANIRWGLDAAHRESLGLPAESLHTWRFGLDRMLLGYAGGEADPAQADWQGIVPLPEVTGLEAAIVGPLYRLIDVLERQRAALAAEHTPPEWADLFRGLLEACFRANDATEVQLVGQLAEAMQAWLDECQDAGLSEPLPLAVAREGWLGRIDAPRLSARYAGGAVTFATLVPMRAIPFAHVCLLGMNDGDFPRQAPRPDFDLMDAPARYRPGDRSRREDERYLFLEALLSARKRLYVSWSGRSLRDNSEQPPSVLVGQLRDHLAAGWRLAGAADENEATRGEALLRALTTEHPLQPFGDGYFRDPEPNADLPATISANRLFTYAGEWSPETTAVVPEHDDLAMTLPPWAPNAPITLMHLVRLLRDPVAALFAVRLKISFPEVDATIRDDEPFSFTGLEAWSEQDALLQPIARRLNSAPDSDPNELVTALAERRRHAGHWPAGSLGEVVGEDLTDAAGMTLANYRSLLHQWPDAVAPAPVIRFDVGATVSGEPVTLELTDTLEGLRAQRDGRHARLILESSRLHEGRDLRLGVLLRHWPAHLAMQLLHPGSTSYIVSRSGTVELPGMAQAAAQARLEDLMRSWLDAMQTVLPIEGELACRVLRTRAKGSDPASDSRVLAQFETLERRGQACARCFPDLATVLGHPRFDAALARLYQPLYDLLTAPEAGAA